MIRETFPSGIWPNGNGAGLGPRIVIRDATGCAAHGSVLLLTVSPS